MLTTFDSDRYANTIFTYVGWEKQPSTRSVLLRYSVGGIFFLERVRFPFEGNWDDPRVDGACEVLFLLAGISYYKVSAAPVIDLGNLDTTARERQILRDYYVHGLGEYSYKNGIDLSGLEVRGPDRFPPSLAGGVVQSSPITPIVPFGGGIDSIVSLELVKSTGADPTLFVVNRPGDAFSAIENPATVSGAPMLQATREIDEKVLRSAEHGFMNGHVPVTGIISAIAVLAAVLCDKNAVVMSNEWSASSPTLFANGQAINHQYSKSYEFEENFRTLVTGRVGTGVEYFSLLRDRTELWIAAVFSRHPEYFSAFRSCNKSFYIDGNIRLDDWCGVCDKCCFTDLILAPFVSAHDLREIFGGSEPLDNPELLPVFRSLLGLENNVKPWECVGDEGECRAAVSLAANRADRKTNTLLPELLSTFPAIGQKEISQLGDSQSPNFVPESLRVTLSATEF